MMMGVGQSVDHYCRCLVQLAMMMRLMLLIQLLLWRMMMWLMLLLHYYHPIYRNILGVTVVWVIWNNSWYDVWEWEVLNDTRYFRTG